MNKRQEEHQSVMDIMIPGLHPGQQMVKDELKKRNIICAHRGWRKSSLGIHLAVEVCLSGQNCAWMAPTFNTITGPNWIDFKRVCGGNEEWFNKSENRWTIPNKGSVYFYSMDRPSSALGGTWSWIFCEELGQWADGVYESIVEPMAQKVDGTIVGYGTPNIVQPHNDFKLLIDQAKNFPDTHNSYVIPAFGADMIDGVLVEGVDEYTKYATCPVPFPTFQSMKDSYTRSRDKNRWMIEYLCKFISSEGGQFSGVESACCLKSVMVYG